MSASITCARLRVVNCGSLRLGPRRPAGTRHRVCHRHRHHGGTDKVSKIMYVHYILAQELLHMMTYKHTLTVTRSAVSLSYNCRYSGPMYLQRKVLAQITGTSHFHLPLPTRFSCDLTRNILCNDFLHAD